MACRLADSVFLFMVQIPNFHHLSLWVLYICIYESHAYGVTLLFCFFFSGPPSKAVEDSKDCNSFFSRYVMCFLVFPIWVLKPCVISFFLGINWGVGFISLVFIEKMVFNCICLFLLVIVSGAGCRNMELG